MSANDSNREPPPFPRAPLIGAGLLILISLLSVGAIRLFGQAGPDAQMQAAERVTERVALRFLDQADGSVEVRAEPGGELLDTLPSGEGNFVRASLRVLVRGRRAVGVGSDEPFEVQRTDRGRLLLHDPSIGETVDLWAFGPDNARAYEAYLITYQENVADGRSTPDSTGGSLAAANQE